MKVADKYELCQQLMQLYVYTYHACSLVRLEMLLFA